MHKSHVRESSHRIDRVSANVLSEVKRCGVCFPVQEPVIPGCFLRARAIGLMPMIDQVSFSNVPVEATRLCSH